MSVLIEREVREHGEVCHRCKHVYPMSSETHQRHDTVPGKEKHIKDIQVPENTERVSHFQQRLLFLSHGTTLPAVPETLGTGGLFCT